ncbi:hypothetical protein CRENPOLYSF1_1740002 [Crenothrix polyspora]|uniref:Uncharacterized protein n=2 Tax=Crenothrix polyspora TaxID=360316 RepID=A0A1R4H4E1_9GAMM|nr:hypothetical protein CRENPOLYSF1_1740002 [Crenothrix polyspora]
MQQITLEKDTFSDEHGQTLVDFFGKMTAGDNGLVNILVKQR